MSEQWREVSGWPYEVSNLGRVRSLGGRKGSIAGRILKAQANRSKSGGEYETVTLRDYPRNWMVRVHHLVLFAFIGPRPSDAHQGNHLNGEKRDNRAENLEWVTSSENIRHAYSTGLNQPSYGNAKLSADDRSDILASHAAGVSKRELAGRYGVSVSAIQLLVQGKTWRGIA